MYQNICDRIKYMLYFTYQQNVLVYANNIWYVYVVIAITYITHYSPISLYNYNQINVIIPNSTLILDCIISKVFTSQFNQIDNENVSSV